MSASIKKYPPPHPEIFQILMYFLTSSKLLRILMWIMASEHTNPALLTAPLTEFSTSERTQRYLKSFDFLLKMWVIFFFFFKVFGRHMCPILGPLVPLFWISGDVSSGFQSQSGFCLIHLFCGGECNVHSPKIHLWCYSCLPLDDQHRSQSLPHMHQLGGSWLRFEQATTRTEDERATIVPVTG